MRLNGVVVDDASDEIADANLACNAGRERIKVQLEAGNSHCPDYARSHPKYPYGSEPVRFLNRIQVSGLVD
jgi:hypothetical protein